MLQLILAAFCQKSPRSVQRVNAKDRDIVLVVGVKVSSMMRRPGFGKHAYDDSEKPAQFRHKTILWDGVAGFLGAQRLCVTQLLFGLSRTPRILYVSDCIFLPSRLTGQISLALSALKSA
jgi:hypothetical protein